MFQVVKMVTNPKTYLACSLKGLYRKAASIRKKIRTHSIIIPIEMIFMIDKIIKYTQLTSSPSSIIMEKFQECDNHHVYPACNSIEWSAGVQPGET